MQTERASRGRLPAPLFVAVAFFHIALAWVCGPAGNWHGQTSEYYQLLTDAFLAGQTSLLVHPPAQLLALPDPYDPVANAYLRLHDASLYHGKYYLYYGPTPAIVLFLPYKVLTGSHLPSRVAVALFCAAGFACSCALFFLLVKREKWDCPGWLASAAVLSLGTAPGVVFLLTRPSFYEVAISAGYCFMMAGFLLVAHAMEPNFPRAKSLLAAGLCFGLAVGCRPDLALPAILMVLLVAWRTRSHKTAALAFAGPVVLCGVLLMGYNYVRFQNAFEFGVRYQLLADRTDLNSHFNHAIGNLLPSIYALVLGRPSDWPCWFDRSVGLLWGSPIALLGLFTPLVLRLRGVKSHVKLGSTGFNIYCVFLSAFCVLVLLALLGFTIGRYIVDFAPEFVLLSWCLLAARWQALHGSARKRLAPFRLAVLGIALYSASVEIWMWTLYRNNIGCR